MKSKDYEHHIDIEIRAVENPTNEEGKKEIDSLRKARRMFIPQLLWKFLNDNETTKVFTHL